MNENNNINNDKRLNRKKYVNSILNSLWSKGNRIFTSLMCISLIGLLAAVIFRNLLLALMMGGIFTAFLVTFINSICDRILLGVKHIISIVVIFMGIVILINGLVLGVKANSAVDLHDINATSIKNGQYVKGRLDNLFVQEITTLSGTKHYSILNDGYTGFIGPDNGYYPVYLFIQNDKCIQVYIRDDGGLDEMEDAMKNLSYDDKAFEFTGVIKKRTRGNVWMVLPQIVYGSEYIGKMDNTKYEGYDFDHNFVDEYVIQEYDYTNYPARIIGGFATIILGFVLLFAFGGLKDIIVPPRQEPEEVEYDGSMYDRWKNEEYETK